MANAMAQAIGAQAAFAGRQVISLSGDGGFTMLMGDFLSLVQLGLPMKVVVFNNGALGFVELERGADVVDPRAILYQPFIGRPHLRLCHGAPPMRPFGSIGGALAHRIFLSADLRRDERRN
jgi:hypothetical protein